MWNEALGWTCILLGMAVGALFGMRFQEPDWLGGYQSRRRRLLRLGHVALIALGVLNILFVQGLSRMALGETAALLASGGLALGALTMPACCALAAHRERSPFVFTVPVASLLLGTALTAWGLAVHAWGVA